VRVANPRATKPDISTTNEPICIAIIVPVLRKILLIASVVEAIEYIFIGATNERKSPKSTP